MISAFSNDVPSKKFLLHYYNVLMMTTLLLGSTTTSPVAAQTFPTADQITVMEAKAAIEELIEATEDVNLAPKFVRLAFHDCVGGCDGCVDLENLDNNGLDIPMDSLDMVVATYETETVTRADLYVLAGLVGAETSQRNDGNQVDYPMNFIGRPTCESLGQCFNADGTVVECSYKLGPHRDLPSNDVTTDGLLHYFATTFQFTAQETVAIMGVHTIGVATREHSGFDGDNGWVRREQILDNEYYRLLVGGNNAQDSFAELYDAPNWRREIIDNSDLRASNADLQELPDRFQWERNGGGGGGGGRGGQGRGGDGGRGGRRRRDDNDVFGNRMLQGGPQVPGGPRRNGPNNNVRRGGNNGDNRGNGGGGRGTVLMLNADISVVRNFTEFLNVSPNGAGVVDCEFKNPAGGRPACPHSGDVLRLAAQYRFNNPLWLTDFRNAYVSMLETGCDAENSACLDFEEFEAV